MKVSIKGFLGRFLIVKMLHLQVAIMVTHQLIGGMEIHTTTMTLTALRLLIQRMFLLGKFRKISHGWVLHGIANNI